MAGAACHAAGAPGLTAAAILLAVADLDAGGATGTRHAGSLSLTLPATGRPPQCTGGRRLTQDLTQEDTAPRLHRVTARAELRRRCVTPRPYAVPGGDDGCASPVGDRDADAR